MSGAGFFTRTWPLWLIFVSLSACATTPKPIEEYTLARAAMDAARIVEAPRHAPGHWHKAEESYRKAQALYKDRYFEEAKAEFIKARRSAERSENAARLIRMKTGEVL